MILERKHKCSSREANYIQLNTGYGVRCNYMAYRIAFLTLQAKYDSAALLEIIGCSNSDYFQTVNELY